MSVKLFNDFSEVSSKQWKQKIQVDLKGADYNDTLIWQTNDGIHVKPFYHSDEFDSLPKPSNTKATDWKICQSIFVNNASDANSKALEILTKGVESIKFIIPNDSVEVAELIKNLDSNLIPIHFELQFLSEEFINQIEKHTTNSKINIDIIGNLARTGNWYYNLNQDHKTLENVITNNAVSLSIDVSLYQNSGANNIQQLAYAVAHLNEYFNHFQNKDLKINFNVAVGTNYFFEIAKLRALRQIYSTLASEYNQDINCHIYASPTKRNKTLYDYNTNMLRTTTECMSAILGGANTICNLPYDAIYHKDNDFGERISRNQLLVLKHESYFDKVDNPSDGSYYIESLTTELAEKALGLFKNIEANGGFLKQLKKGTIQRKIKESAQKEQQQFNDAEEILLGTNKHANPNDKMKHELELYPFVKTNTRKTLIEPIIEKRLAEKIEQDRLKTE